MRTLFLRLVPVCTFSALAIVCMLSCIKTDDTVAAVFEISKTTLTLPTSATINEDLVITYNRDWTVAVQASAAEWLSVTPEKGYGVLGSMTTKIQVIVKANPLSTSRKGTLTLRCDGKSYIITVVQTGVNPSIKVTPDQLALPTSGGNSKVVVSSNVAWEAAATKGDEITLMGKKVKWLTLDKVAGGNPTVAGIQNEELPFTFISNDGTIARNAVITITTDTEAVELKVSQPASNSVLDVLCEGVAVIGNTADIPDKVVKLDDTFKVKANFPWTATISDNKTSTNQEWIKLITTAGGTADATTEEALSLDLLVRNEKMESRKCVITINGSGTGTGQKYTLTLEQPAGTPYVEIRKRLANNTSRIQDTDTLLYNQTSLYSGICVKSNTTWQIKATSPWITITPTDYGLNNEETTNSIDMKLLENESVETRLGFIALTTTYGSNDMHDTIWIFQTEKPLDLSKTATANCYIASPYNKKFTFTATVKGNGSGSNTAISPKTAKVLWETGTDEGNVIKSNIQLINNNTVLFETNNPGNAVIAACDQNGAILWTWHIWVVANFDPEATAQTYSSGAVMMDRDLGAMNAVVDDPGSMGFYYQWGRKDPFRGRESFNSNELLPTTNADYWKVEAFSESMKDVSGDTFSYSIQHPMSFISSAKSWYTSSSENLNHSLWSDNKTIYDPCPPGWKVPVASTTWKDFTSANATKKSYGYLFSNNGRNVWYPMSGWYLNTGDLDYVKKYSARTTSTADVKSHNISVYSLNACVVSNVPQSLGFPVRCVHETN